MTTPLILACRMADMESALLLLSGGVGCYTIERAIVESRNIAFMKAWASNPRCNRDGLFFDRLRSEKVMGANMALRFACYEVDIDLVRYLVEVVGIDVATMDPRHSALTYVLDPSLYRWQAALPLDGGKKITSLYRKRIELCRYLMQHGANPLSRSEFGMEEWDLVPNKALGSVCEEVRQPIAIAALILAGMPTEYRNDPYLFPDEKTWLAAIALAERYRRQ